MYSQFGQKWSRLHNGPMWSVSCKESSDSVHSQATMKVRNNLLNLSLVSLVGFS